MLFRSNDTATTEIYTACYTLSLHDALPIRERRQLDLHEKAELDRATRQMWARLSPGHEWLRDWEYV